ncbi:MAG: inorganic phosphate transporter, partial [Candidatus Neomarinimicrobiota bacterium]
MYLFIVIVLFVFAISGLVVGVTNDAVNFLNSANGAKAAKSWIIMLIASFGILIGTTFSSGMMDIARKGIFVPTMFEFSEIMFIYLAVVLTNVILLDIYNTLALPTSTTVSVVFSLLGAALAASIMKIDEVSQIPQYINTDKALAIIAGILLSVVIAFTVGTVVQFVTRLIFSFRYEKALKRYGAIWGGFCIAAITYFILIKGAKGSSFMSNTMYDWIQDHTLLILGMSFLGWSLLIQTLRSLFKINIPRLIILVGTFSLAFAFAGNDLVNFIGVPLAGFEAYLAENSMTGAIPETFLLLIAGAIMTITLWFSKKSKHVSETELSIASQDVGDERFASSALSRSVVHGMVVVNDFFAKIVPTKLKHKVSERFSRPAIISNSENQSFDMIRASMNLTIASSLIALGTSLKLPLSTTYVTFMVSMGTSLADKAWGRESAVYRMTGVFTVIGGWFLTAIIALFVSMLFSFLLLWGGMISVLGLVALAIFLLVRSSFVHKKKEKEKTIQHEIEESNDLLVMCNDHTLKILDLVPDILEDNLKACYKEDRKKIKAINVESKFLMEDTKNRKNNFTLRLRDIDEDSLEYGHFYLQMLHYIREFSHSIDQIVGASYEHIYNNHRGLSKEEYEELDYLSSNIKDIFK